MEKRSVTALTEDAILCALLIVSAITVYPLLGTAKAFLGMGLGTCFACLNQSKGLLRVLTLYLVMILLLFFILGGTLPVYDYAWWLMTGVVLSLTLQMDTKRFFGVSLILLLLLQIARIFITFYMMAGDSPLEYFSGISEKLYGLLNIPNSLAVDRLFFICILLGLVLMRCIIAYQANIIYKKRILPRIRKETF